jgi:hypothetical protein
VVEEQEQPADFEPKSSLAGGRNEGQQCNNWTLLLSAFVPGRYSALMMIMMMMMMMMMIPTSVTKHQRKLMTEALILGISTTSIM